MFPSEQQKKGNGKGARGTELKEAVLSLWVFPPHSSPHTSSFLGLEHVEAAPSASAMLMFVAGKSFVAGAVLWIVGGSAVSLASAHQVPTSAPLQTWTSFPRGVVGLLRKAWVRHKDGLWSLRRKPRRHDLGSRPSSVPSSATLVTFLHLCSQFLIYKVG